MNRYIKVIKADKIYKRLFGLMFKSNINISFYIPKCNAIHTFFVKINLDIILLDKNNKVIEIKKNITKNKIIKFKYNINNSNILEVPSNLNFSCNVGDTIIFI